MVSFFQNRNNIFIAIIFIFHAVGFFGFMLNPIFFKPLSSLNLILSVFLVLLATKKNNFKLYISLFLIAVIGFFIEVVGVKTGLVFGNYHYGNSFGLKLLSVPVLIGVNWAVLLYSIAQYCNLKSKISNTILSSLLMVILDFFIEQCAAKFDFWYWENNIIPIQNYIAWFIISFFINIVFQNNLRQQKNKVAAYFYIVQLLFFGFLYVLNV